MAEPGATSHAVQGRGPRDGTVRQLVSIAREADPTALVVSVVLGLVTSVVAPFFPLLAASLGSYTSMSTGTTSEDCLTSSCGTTWRETSNVSRGVLTTL